MFSGHIQLKSLSFLQPGYCLYWFENSREMSDSMFTEKNTSGDEVVIFGEEHWLFDWVAALNSCQQN